MNGAFRYNKIKSYQFQDFFLENTGISVSKQDLFRTTIQHTFNKPICQNN